jgi:hypothetical protein
MGILPPLLWQVQACRFFPSGPTHFNDPVKSRKSPTQVEVNHVEQSLILISADLVRKKEELTSLKR